MTFFEHYKSGNLFGIEYTFEKPGDRLPSHTHVAVDSHNVVVLSGSISLRSDDDTWTFHAGSVVDFPWQERHEIVGLEPGTTILNFFLNGQPEEYKSLSAEHLTGSFDIWSEP